MRPIRMAFAAALVAILAIGAPVTAGNPFRGLTSTEDGYHTFDADQINVEAVDETGAGVYVAVLDTGLVANWKDYFPEERVAEELGAGFYQSVNFKQKNADPCGVDVEIGPLHRAPFTGSRGSSHGTHVTSTIIGYNYYSNTDAAQGFPLPPIQVRGIAPNATIIPVKVLADYQIPRLPKCEDEDVPQGQLTVFGTDSMVAAGIDHVTALAEGQLAGSRVVINMSLGDVVPAQVIEDAIDRAIEAGVIVVASAGNEGEAGMGWPGAYSQVISVGASGWTGEWLDGGATGTAPSNGVRNRMFWLQAPDLLPDPYKQSGQVTDPTDPSHVYVTDFSSRETDPATMDLDVLAPGSWIRGPFAGFPGYNHLPFWSKGIADLLGANPGNFFYVGGTSMAAPHVAAAAALMLEKDASLTQAAMESILEVTALPIGAGSAQVWDPFLATPAFTTVSWGADAVGSGLIQVDAAIAATP